MLERTEEANAPKRRSRLPVAFISAAIVALVFLALVSPGPFRPGRRSGGPLQSDGDALVGQSVEVGGTVTFGAITVHNEGAKSAVLERVRFVPGLPDGLTLLGIQVAADPEREINSVGTDLGYPPMGEALDELKTLWPFEGFRVPPRSTPEGERGAPLLMGFRLESGGVASFRRVDLDYHVGRKRYTAKINVGYVVCVPEPTTTPDACDREIARLRALEE